MTIYKHDERLLTIISTANSYKFFLLDPGDSDVLRIPVSDFRITEEANNGYIYKGITAQSILNLNGGSIDNLLIPDSVILGGDGYYSVDYSKLDYTLGRSI